MWVLQDFTIARSELHHQNPFLASATRLHHCWIRIASSKPGLWGCCKNSLLLDENCIFKTHFCGCYKTSPLLDQKCNNKTNFPISIPFTIAPSQMLSLIVSFNKLVKEHNFWRLRAISLPTSSLEIQSTVNELLLFHTMVGQAFAAEPFMVRPDKIMWQLLYAWFSRGVQPCHKCSPTREIGLRCLPWNRRLNAHKSLWELRVFKQWADMALFWFHKCLPTYQPKYPGESYQAQQNISYS